MIRGETYVKLPTSLEALNQSMLQNEKYQKLFIKLPSNALHQCHCNFHAILNGDFTKNGIGNLISINLAKYSQRNIISTLQ